MTIPRDGETPILEHWRMCSTHSLQLNPDKVVVLDNVLSMSQIEQFNYFTVCKQMTYVESQYLKPFNCMQKLNYWYYIAIL